MRGEQGTAMFSTDRARRFDAYQRKEAPCAALTQPEPRLPGTKEGQRVRYTALAWQKEREGVGGGYLLAGGAVVEEHTRRRAHLNPLNSRAGSPTVSPMRRLRVAPELMAGVASQGSSRQQHWLW